MLQYSPKIITDSLVMCLDASQNKSYPTDLPVKNGLVMWMDAADDTTFSYSSGTTVSQWRDKSGFNYHMVPVSAGPTRNAFLNSRKVIACTTSQQIWNSAINLSTSIYTIFGVTRLTGATNNRVLTTQYVASAGGNWLLGHWGGYVNQYYAEGWVAGPYGTAANTAWNIFMGDWSGSSTDLANLYTNGTAIATNSNGASAGPIGLGINVNSETSTCEAAEIIVFNRVLSATERKQVNTYLGQKWGISNTDRSIVDLSNNNNNGLLGNGTVANMPEYDYYNKGALSFSQSLNDTVLTPLPITATPALSNFTYEVWTKLNRFPPIVSPPNVYGVTYRAGFLFGASYYGGAGLLWVGDTNGNAFYLYAFIRGTDAYRETNAYSFNTNQYYHCVMVNNYGANKLQLYINGTLYSEVATATSQYDASNASAAGNIGISKAQIGGGGTANYSHYDGVVPVARIYNKALSAAEVLQNYEAQKSKFANTIIQQGLVLNLDAGNPYSYAGAGTAWYDVSGNTKDFIIDGSGITYNSGGYFNLADGGATRTATITNSITCTVIVWIRTTDTQALTFKGNNSGSFYLAAYYVGSGFYSDNCGSPTYWIDTVSVSNPNPTYLDGNWHMWEMKNVNFSSWTTYEFNRYGGFTFGNGAVGQIMIYDRNLSSTESLQIYNATKGRFGL